MARVAKLYGAMERMHLAELRRRTAAAAAVQAATERQQKSLDAVGVWGREALVRGEGDLWRLAASERRLLTWRSEGLERLLQERSAACAEARLRYDESRTRTGQIDRICAEAAKRESAREEWLAQAETDARHLSRTKWLAWLAAAEEI